MRRFRKSSKAFTRESGEATIAAIVKLATEACFRFTAEEYAAFVKEELANEHSAGALEEKGWKPLQVVPR